MSTKLDETCLTFFLTALRNARKLTVDHPRENALNARVGLFHLANSIYGSFIGIAISNSAVIEGKDEIFRTAIKLLAQKLTDALVKVESWQELLIAVETAITEWLASEAETIRKDDVANVRDRELRKLTRRFSEILFGAVSLEADVFDEPGDVNLSIQQMLEQYQQWLGEIET